ncbi:glycosyltransferase family 2 protein [Alistipes ihumii]|uniref:glycosyltransferase family 2 protein n=1 Tax=Alistipes ihumii TaxID=1470347 RepID=UPI002664FD49|nr:glycosyltransferase [Alistipes ihumii]
MPSISVIIPMYNSERTIEKALDSVVGQTYPAHYQIIVVDDGSSDRSAELVERYAEAHPSADIRLIRQSNGGVSSARNAGMRAATGQWIALLDSDDQWLPDKTRIQMDILSRYPQIDLLGSNVNHEQTRILWRLKDRLSPVKPWELFIKWHPSTPTVVFRRSVIEAIGYYNEAMRHGEDGEFLLRICMRKSCWFTPEHLVFCGEGKPTFGDSGLSADLLAMQRGQRQILKYARKERAIGPIQYVFFRLYAELKHWRRVIIVYNRNRKKR